MSITARTGTAGTNGTTSGTADAAKDGQAPGRRLPPEQLEAVDATQRAHLSFAQSPDAPEGEHLVRRSVELLAPYGWHHLRMVTWRQATPGTVAHLVVGPGGVVVIDERIWTDPVYVDAGVLRLGGFPCDREIAALGDAVSALAALLPAQHRAAVAGVVCVTPRDMPAQTVGGVTLVGRLHLGGLLAGLEQRLSLAEVYEVAQALTVAFDGPGSTPGPVPGGVPTQRTSPESRRPPTQAPAPSEYFARPQSTPADTAPTPAGSGGTWRTAAARVAIVALVALLTYQGSEAITVAVDEWLGGGGIAVVAEG